MLDVRSTGARERPPPANLDVVHPYRSVVQCSKYMLSITEALPTGPGAPHGNVLGARLESSGRTGVVYGASVEVQALVDSDAMPLCIPEWIARKYACRQ
jgi:hypothetical protein